MKRRRAPGALTVDDLPEHLRRFSGSTPTGWSEEYAAWTRDRAAWLRAHGLNVLDLMRREVADRRVQMHDRQGRVCAEPPDQQGD